MTTAIVITVSVLLLLCMLYLFLLMPRRRRAEAAALLRVPYAHRGLHGGRVAENSLSAFRLAAAQGYGIELDVQLSLDGEVMVFHDENLSRVTGVDASLCLKTREELAALRLSGTDEGVPTLREVLAAVNGRVPLLVEIKSDHALRETCERTAAILDGYTGDYMIESFHPLAVNWFRRHRPAVVRGQLSARLFKRGDRTLPYFLVQNLLLNFLARPDFIAYDGKGRDVLAFRLCRTVWRPYTVAWTVKDREGLAETRTFDTIIFESLSAEELADGGRIEKKEGTV